MLWGMLSLRLTTVVFLLTCLSACGEKAPPSGFKPIKDIDYVGAGNPRQTLDLFLPEKTSAQPLPLVIYIHGGGWQGGSKNDAGATG
jgi:acetyl esterase/lipase